MTIDAWIRPRRGFDRSELGRCLLVVIAVNVLGAAPALLGGPSTPWFENLQKPALYPPSWAFGVVWTILFTLLGIAVYLVVRAGLESRRVRLALGIFGLQFLFNAAWTPVFFGLQRPLAALGILVVLDVLIAVTIAAFARVERFAASLLVPYLLWALFATLLNYQFWALNG